jgi:arabinogalactan endo-1,4-beta-galactosidase
MNRAALLLLALAAATLNAPASAKPFYLGADLSYVNEMEDCGAVYRDGRKKVDPFALMRAKGGNIVRVRIWNDARWTRYSNYDDVLKTIRRAHAADMQVLLDFHYSDDWADGDKQLVPASWAAMTTENQAKALYDYTRDILSRLAKAGHMPELVQVGNETNPELMGGKIGMPINWERNVTLFNAGIKAVRDAGVRAGKSPKVMLHIAQPENVLPWFDAAKSAGIANYDMIGVSYYRKWSKFDLAQLGLAIAETRRRYDRDVMVVETAYPFTVGFADMSPNLLGNDSLIAGYPATPDGQRRYMIDLTQLVRDSGGNGVVYWEPAWVSTKCKTRWGVGSNWENAAWFDLRHHRALPVMDFLKAPAAKSD